jgi:hypothetical protein
MVKPGYGHGLVGGYGVGHHGDGMVAAFFQCVFAGVGSKRGV